MSTQELSPISASIVARASVNHYNGSSMNLHMQVLNMMNKSIVIIWTYECVNLKEPTCRSCRSYQLRLLCHFTKIIAPKVVSTSLFKGQLKWCKTLSCLKRLEQKQMNSFPDCLMYNSFDFWENVIKIKVFCQRKSASEGLFWLTVSFK